MLNWLLYFHPSRYDITIFIVGEILAAKAKEDVEKRNQLSELKTEMEREIKVSNFFLLYTLCHFAKAPAQLAEKFNFFGLFMSSFVISSVS